MDDVKLVLYGILIYGIVFVGYALFLEYKEKNRKFVTKINETQ